MAPLAAWGARRSGELGTDEPFRPRWVAVAMVGLADAGAAEGVHETYQYVVGEQAFHFAIDDGAIEVFDGRAHAPAFVVSTDERTWADLASGNTRTSAALARGTLSVEGDAEAWERLKKIFSRRRMLALGRSEF